MVENDTWRRQLAEERLGNALTPGFARQADAGRADVVTDDVRPMQPPQTVAAPIAPPSVRPHRTSPLDVSRSVPTRWIAGGIVAALLAAGAGWMAHGSGPSATIYVPVRGASRIVPAMPAAATAGPQADPPRAVSVAPRAADPTTIPSPLAVPSPTPTPTAGITRHAAQRAHEGAPSRDRRAETAAEAITSSSRLHHHDRMQQPEAFAATGTVARPSFECRRPVSDVTRAICGDRHLAALDRQLAARFSLLDRSVDPATIQALHHGETSFLNARQSCADKACLTDAYRQRLHELNDIEP